jgi:hypothetical protein
MKNLSIVFQGPAAGPDGELQPDVLLNLQRTRQVFPAAEIILSTWMLLTTQIPAWHRHLRPLEIKLILSEDPGALAETHRGVRYVTNVNRLLVSSSAGLAAASQLLAVKLRTDTWLSSRGVVNLLRQQVLSEDPAIPRDPAFTAFRARVINAEWFARDARGSLPYLYHPGDIFLAGYTTDLRLFFSAPPAGPDLFHPTSVPGLGCPWRYVPEQWFWLHAIHQVRGRWVYPGNFTHSEENIAASEQWYLANFIPCSARTLGLHWPKYWRCYPLRGLFSMYTPRRWQRLAARYQGQYVRRLPDVLDDFLSVTWRCGYRLRERILRHDLLRRIARRLFVHRRQ